MVDAGFQHALRRRFPRTVTAGVVLVVVFALIAFWQLRRPRRQENLIEQIRAVAGFVSTDPPPTLTERISAYRSGSGWLAGYTAVGLYTSDITGEWLTEHDDLAALDITDLKLAETALSDADLASFVSAHPLHVVQFRDEQIADQTVAALADRRELTILEVRDCPLRDDQLARLPLEQLEELRIDGTQVTSLGLAELRRAEQLVVLTVDGRQFGDGTSEILNALPALRVLDLFGSDVTDERLQRLNGVKALEFIQLTRTSATAEGVKRLQATLPKCEVSVR